MTKDRVKEALSMIDAEAISHIVTLQAKTITEQEREIERAWETSNEHMWEKESFKRQVKKGQQQLKELETKSKQEIEKLKDEIQRLKKPGFFRRLFK